MIKRSFLLIFVLICFVGTLSAQNGKRKYEPRGEVYHSEDTNVVKGKYGIGWVRSHLFDDWFFQFQGGGQLYYGTDDREGPFGDRLTGNAEFNIGRRIFPMFGFRVGLGYGYAHGFLTKEHYDQNRGAILAHGYTGQCGTDPVRGSLGGYYWNYNDDLLIQKWKYFYFGGDVFLDLGILKGTENYNPDRHWNHILYAGVHTKYALSETDTTNHRTEAHLGYICKYNFNRNWSIYADVRASAIERLFDREWVPGLESAGAALDGILNAHIGITYKFHIRTPEERNEFRAIEQSDGEMRNVVHFMYVKMQDTNFVVMSDTLVSGTRYDSIPTQGMLDTLNWLNNDINMWIAAINALNGKDGDLDTNMLGLLLPYEQLFFERDKWDILPSEEAKIAKMAEIMERFPDTKYILIGSADSKTGTPQRNDFLSHVRADVVYNALVDQYGIDPSRLDKEFKGGILEYTPFELNRSTVILMDHPYVRRVFEEMVKKGKAGGMDVEIK